MIKKTHIRIEFSAIMTKFRLCQIWQRYSPCRKAIHTLFKFKINLLSSIYRSCNSCLICSLVVLCNTNGCKFKFELIKNLAIFAELELELKYNCLSLSLLKK